MMHQLVLNKHSKCFQDYMFASYLMMPFQPQYAQQKFSEWDRNYFYLFEGMHTLYKPGESTETMKNSCHDCLYTSQTETI